MNNVVVVGSQWGDEGKGKIVDWLSSEADIVVRFQGGHNAGHTLVIDKKVFKLRLLPSGIVREGKISILGNGLVIDPWALLDEIEDIKEVSSKQLKGEMKPKVQKNENDECKTKPFAQNFPNKKKRMNIEKAEYDYDEDVPDKNVINKRRKKKWQV